MANTLFIKFTSVPLQPNVDNLSFKYTATGGALTTVTVVFGTGPSKCPISTTGVNGQAALLATFLSANSNLIVPTPTGDTVTIVAQNGSNITGQVQPLMTVTAPTQVYVYETYDDEAGTNQPLHIHYTVPNFPASVLGVGTQVTLEGIWHSDLRHCWTCGWSNCCGDFCAENAVINKTWNVQSDISMTDFFNTVIDPSSEFQHFANDMIACSDQAWRVGAPNAALVLYGMEPNGLPGETRFKFKFGGSANDVNDYRPVHQKMKFSIKRQPPGTKYTIMTLTSGDTLSGVAKQIKLDTLQKVATFLSTDFLDLSGKNNQVAYSNPNNINFDDALTSPTVSPNTTVVICKEASTGGNPINSYEFGSAGGFNPNSYTVPGWEWWNRSYLVRDSIGQGGEGDTIYSDLVYLISQQIDTGTSDPGTKAIDS